MGNLRFALLVTLSSVLVSPAFAQVSKQPASKGISVKQEPCSIAQIGGKNNNAKIDCMPVCPWTKLKEADYIAIGKKVGIKPAVVFIALTSDTKQAADFAGYLASSLSNVAHWNVDSFERAFTTADVPIGVTVIVRDETSWTDSTHPAALLKKALEGKGLKITKQIVPTLNKQDDLGVIVSNCE